jgi:hypothetical protein
MEAWAEALLLPALTLAAWIYYPYCERGPNMCIWKALLHKSCPGCGLVRGMCYLVHGHFRAALEFNLLTPLAYVLIAVNSVRTWSELRVRNRSSLRAHHARLLGVTRRVLMVWASWLSCPPELNSPACNRPAESRPKV